MIVPSIVYRFALVVLLVGVTIPWTGCSDSDDPSVTTDDVSVADTGTSGTTGGADVPDMADTSEPDTSETDTSEPDTAPEDTDPPEDTSEDTSEPDTSEPDTSEPDTSEPDTSEPDTSEPDTALEDTDPPEDTSEPDTSEPDTSEPDTAPEDTDPPEDTSEDTSEPDVPEDTAPNDTGEPDTAPEDTSEPDTAPEDTDPPEDTSEDTSEPDVPEDTEPDVPEVLYGLDERPANPTCVAPDRPQVGSVAIEPVRVFPNLTFSLPIALFREPGDNSTWYVGEKLGRILAFDNNPNATESRVFMDITDRVRVSTSPNDERGLLGMAFHPDYARNRELYVSYTATVNNQTWSRVSRFLVGDNGTVNTNSESIVLQFRQPYNNHNGGDIKFGPDGLLYLAFGDGGSGGDPDGNGQNTDTLMGALLRIDVDRNRGQETPYGIPSDNPFAEGGGAPEIFAWGLRNPWRFSFDRETGEIWTGDVGQNSQEETNVIRLGGNYGWAIREGDACYNGNPECGTALDLEPPITVYNHSEGRSITGGYVYRGSQIPALVGSYLYGDYVSGRLWGVFYDEDGEPYPEQLLDTSFNIASFGEDAEGELYVLNYGQGNIFALRPVAEPPTDTFPQLLSETGCVNPDDPSQPNAGMIPYTVNAPFWSDGAEKSRWFAIPDGTTITLDEQGDFIFPPGTVTLKSFRLQNQLFETRLFVRHDDGSWAGYTYAWDDTLGDGVLLESGRVADVAGQSWIYPSRPQCLQCHTEAAGRSLGLEILQLDGPLTYPRTGRTANQLLTLAEVGLLEGLPDDLDAQPALVNPSDSDADLTLRVRSWLHTNSSSCHRPGGPARGELYTSWWDDLTEACNAPPELGDLGIDDARLIAHADPERSMIWNRTGRRDVHGMPPLGSNLVDTEALDMLAAWIESDFCEGIEPPVPAALTCSDPGVIDAVPFNTSDNTAGRGNNHTGVCDPNTGTEAIYAFTAPSSGTWCASTDGSAHDTFLYVRTACEDAASEIACNDDIAWPGNSSSADDFALEGGQTAYIFVDGYNGSGPFVLNVTAGGCP